MKSLDSIFTTEVNSTMASLSAINSNIGLLKIPIPSDLGLYVARSKSIVPKGIDEEYYSKLNGVSCYVLRKQQLYRRKFGHDGEFKRNEDNSYIFENYHVPLGHVAVASSVCLHVPLSFKPKESDTYDYVDVINSKNLGVQYIYVLPKSVCYAVNYTALVLSFSKLKKFYSGMGFQSIYGHTFYLYVIPYKPTESSLYQNYRILGTKTSDDYTKDVESIVASWLKAGLIYDSSLGIMGDGTNILFKSQTSNFSEYIQMDTRPLDKSSEEDIDSQLFI